MTKFIPFNEISNDYLTNHLEDELKDTHEVIKQIENSTKSSWQEIMLPLNEALYKVNQIWGIVNHLQNVKDSPELRDLHEKYLPIITNLYVNLGQNQKLYQHIKNIHENEYHDLSQEEQKIIGNELRDFKLSGITLPLDQQSQFKQIQNQLSELSSKFEHNVLDATDGYIKYVTKAELNGVPEDNLALYHSMAEEDSKEGYKITLHAPSYMPIMQYADNRNLREELYHAYVTRASELSDEGKFDNTSVINQILQLRKQKAQLLGFANYAELSLYKKMAKTPDEVLTFLYDLADKSRNFAQNDLMELHNYAKQVHNINDLQVWDIPYYSEKLQQEKYSYSSNELKQYFPLPKVFDGLFLLVKNLYQVDFVANYNVPTWHSDVVFYDISRSGSTIGHIYLDLYSRGGKQPGAWMDSAQDRNLENDFLKLPIAYIVCNFTKPLGDKPSLLTFDDVQALFHEMGHALHHLLTTVNNASIAGINGVEWDAVELPSQFMENFVWDYKILDTLSEHVDTKASLPKDLFAKVLASRHYQSGLQMLRQLEFAIFDLLLHSQFDAAHDNYHQLINEVRQKVSVINPPQYNRFANSFAHIFAGGYAAGYYSYKWAEVLACDVFSVFEGKDNLELTILGQKFQESILSQGSISPMMDNFKKFMGREPQIDALLKSSGMMQ